MVYKNNFDLKNAIVNFKKVIEFGEPKEKSTKFAQSFVSDVKNNFSNRPNLS